MGLDREDPAAADDVVLLNQLHLPVDRVAVLRLSSKDVIHAFSVVEMRVKRDAEGFAAWMDREQEKLEREVDPFWS